MSNFQVQNEKSTGMIYENYKADQVVYWDIWTVMLFIILILFLGCYRSSVIDQVIIFDLNYPAQVLGQVEKINFFDVELAVHLS